MMGHFKLRRMARLLLFVSGKINELIDKHVKSSLHTSMRTSAAYAPAEVQHLTSLQISE